MHAKFRKLVGKPIYYAFIGITIATAIIAVVYLILLFIYGFFNPDRPAWLGTVDEKRSIFESSESARDDYQAVQILNIHARYTSWFSWGFINWFIPPLTVLLSYYSYRKDWRCGQVAVAITSCWGTCSILVWLILGMAWRFNYDG